MRTASKELQEEKTVNFDMIFTRQYSTALSDNPSVSSGPALGLGWDFKESMPIQVDEYESLRGSRKDQKAMTVPRTVREAILKVDCGYSRMELARGVRKINAIKAKRRQTITNLQNQKAEERLEELRHYVNKRMMCKTKSDAEEMEMLWIKAANYAAAKT